MIELKFKSDFNKIKNVFVGKLLSKKEINEKNNLYNKNESFLVQAEYNGKKMSIIVILSLEILKFSQIMRIFMVTFSFFFLQKNTP